MYKSAFFIVKKELADNNKQRRKYHNINNTCPWLYNDEQKKPGPCHCLHSLKHIIYRVIPFREWVLQDLCRRI